MVLLIRLTTWRFILGHLARKIPCGYHKSSVGSVGDAGVRSGRTLPMRFIARRSIVLSVEKVVEILESVFEDFDCGEHDRELAGMDAMEVVDKVLRIVRERIENEDE
jgi:hypothetical protein